MKLKAGQRRPFKRRWNQKTDYNKRLALLKSGLPRLVVRRGNDNIHIQIIQYDSKGDKTVVEEISRNLKEQGWTGHCGNLPAAYLTGMMIGYKAVKAGIESAILDAGLQVMSKGNAVFAAVKGAIDAGLDIPVGEESLPDAERITGTHTKNSDATAKNFAETKANIEKTFSK